MKVIILLLFWNLGVDASNRIVFYGDKNLRGRFFEEDLDSARNGSCTNLPSNGEDRASSIRKPNSACVLLYNNRDCSGLSIRLYGKGNYNELPGFDNMAKSFRPCNDQEGGKRINVDFHSTYIPDGLLASKPNLCECEPLDDHTASNVWAINNHGNCVKLYKGKMCTGPAVRLGAGRSPKSDNLEKVDFNNKVRSISPCEGHPPCVELQAKILEVEILPDDKAGNGEEKDLEMKSDIEIKNDGRGRVSEDHTAKKSFTESVEVTRMTSSSVKHISHASVTVTTTVNTGIPLVAEGKVKTAITASYTNHQEHSTSEGTSTRKEESREFTVNRRFDIPPCTMYVIRTWVKFMDNVPLKFVTLSEVSGELNGKRMGVQELKRHIMTVGLNFVKELNTTAVLAKEEGYIKLSYGVKSETDGRGTRIPGCVE